MADSVSILFHHKKIGCRVNVNVISLIKDYPIDKENKICQLLTWFLNPANLKNMIFFERKSQTTEGN
jgi:hypothetical protein